MKRAFLITALLFVSGAARAADPASVLEGTWHLALGGSDRILSINAHDQTALYCDGGHCSEGPYNVARVVGSTLFLSVAGPRPLRLIIYVQDQTHISIAEEGRPAFPFGKTLEVTRRASEGVSRSSSASTTPLASVQRLLRAPALDGRAMSRSFS